MHRTGVLVVRVWLEEGVEHDALRARISQERDIDNPTGTESAARSEEEILGVVADWLKAFQT